MSSAISTVDKKIRKEKDIMLEFDLSLKDLKTQLNEQLKCFDAKVDTELAILVEIQDYFKRRSEIEMEYSRNLDKLVRNIQLRHKNEKSKREHWPSYTPYSIWQNLLSRCKEDSRNHSAVSDLYFAVISPRLTQIMEDNQRIHKRCKEIGYKCHEEIFKVLSELNTAIKSYHIYNSSFKVSEQKLKLAEGQMNKIEIRDKISASKKKIITKTGRRQEKYVASKLKVDRARNEYILCLAAANTTIYRFFQEDMNDLLDCGSIAFLPSLSATLQLYLQGQDRLIYSNQEGMRETVSIINNLDSKGDKQHFFEIYNTAFQLPNKMSFKQHRGDLINSFTADPEFGDELVERHVQLASRLTSLRTENDEIWKTLETAEQSLLSAVYTACQYNVGSLFSAGLSSTTAENTPTINVPAIATIKSGGILADTSSSSGIISGFGYNSTGQISSKSSTTSSSELLSVEPTNTSINTNTSNDPSITYKNKMDHIEIEDYYIKKFREYLLSGDLIARLQAKFIIIHNAVQQLNRLSDTLHMEKSTAQQISSLGGIQETNVQQPTSNNNNNNNNPTSGGPTSDSNNNPNILPSAVSGAGPPGRTGKRFIGAKAVITGLSGVSLPKPKLFGGSLEEYLAATGQDIPLIMLSTIRVINLYGLHHQGIFRVSGSQVEINEFKAAFERGEDPLIDVKDSRDINSVAGVLKLYLRELREPLFPTYMFDQLVNLGSKIASSSTSTNPDEYLQELKDLLSTLPKSVYLTIRYLFAFLNHLSQYSDENMMDAYNLAVCFGPTLIPIPSDRDQVTYQASVNELIRVLITKQDFIFPVHVPKIVGPTKDGSQEGVTTGAEDSNTTPTTSVKPAYQSNVINAILSGAGPQDIIKALGAGNNYYADEGPFYDKYCRYAASNENVNTGVEGTNVGGGDELNTSTFDDNEDLLENTNAQEDMDDQLDNDSSKDEILLDTSDTNNTRTPSIKVRKPSIPLHPSHSFNVSEKRKVTPATTKSTQSQKPNHIPTGSNVEQSTILAANSYSSESTPNTPPGRGESDNDNTNTQISTSQTIRYPIITAETSGKQSPFEKSKHVSPSKLGLSHSFVSKNTKKDTLLSTDKKGGHSTTLNNVMDTPHNYGHTIGGGEMKDTSRRPSLSFLFSATSGIPYLSSMTGKNDGETGLKANSKKRQSADTEFNYLRNPIKSLSPLHHKRHESRRISDIKNLSNIKALHTPSFLAVARFNFIGRNPDELSFNKGDIMRPIKKVGPEWWRVALIKPPGPAIDSGTESPAKTQSFLAHGTADIMKEGLVPTNFIYFVPVTTEGTDAASYSSLFSKMTSSLWSSPLLSTNSPQMPVHLSNYPIATNTSIISTSISPSMSGQSNITSQTTSRVTNVLANCLLPGSKFSTEDKFRQYTSDTGLVHSTLSHMPQTTYEKTLDTFVLTGSDDNRLLRTPSGSVITGGDFTSTDSFINDTRRKMTPLQRQEAWTQYKASKEEGPENTISFTYNSPDRTSGTNCSPFIISPPIKRIRSPSNMLRSLDSLNNSCDSSASVISGDDKSFPTNYTNSAINSNVTFKSNTTTSSNEILRSPNNVSFLSDKFHSAGTSHLQYQFPYDGTAHSPLLIKHIDDDDHLGFHQDVMFAKDNVGSRNQKPGLVSFTPRPFSQLYDLRDKKDNLKFKHDLSVNHNQFSDVKDTTNNNNRSLSLDIPDLVSDLPPTRRGIDGSSTPESPTPNTISHAPLQDLTNIVDSSLAPSIQQLIRGFEDKKFPPMSTPSNVGAPPTLLPSIQSRKSISDVHPHMSIAENSDNIPVKNQFSYTNNTNINKTTKNTNHNVSSHWWKK